MIDLDDVEGIRAADPGGMLEAIAGTGAQIREGYDTSRTVREVPDVGGVGAITFCGMGGSAVAGDVARAAFRGRLGIPFDVVRTPELPAYVGRQTLVVCSSFSGTTAETLACFHEALARGARVVVVTSGGELAAKASAAAVPIVPVPAGFQPRAAVGYLAFALLGSLEAMGLLPPLEADVREVGSLVDGLARRLGPEAPADENLAKLLALRVRQLIPVIWGAEGIASVAAARWKTQMNENAKVPAFSSALPELDHNEVVGWSEGAGRGFFLVVLRTREEHPEVAPRVPVSIEIAREAGMEVQQVEAAGHSSLAELFSLTMTGDFVSAYLGLLRGFDPTPVDAIVRLKRALAGGQEMRRSPFPETRGP